TYAAANPNSSSLERLQSARRPPHRQTARVHCRAARGRRLHRYRGRARPCSRVSRNFTREGGGMSATILQFPRRGPWRVEVTRERDGDGWLVLGPRGHGQLCGSLVDALVDASRLAAEHGVSIAILADLHPHELRVINNRIHATP